MNRKKRTEILIKGNSDLAEKIEKEIINKYEVKEMQEPNHGLVMIKVRDSAKKELFYLGEVLVTEAKYYVNGNLGIGVVVGDKEKLARSLAIIDAAYKAKVEEIEKWNKLLKAEEDSIKKKEVEEAMKILKTKVDFNTMNL